MKRVRFDQTDNSKAFTRINWVSVDTWDLAHLLQNGWRPLSNVETQMILWVKNERVKIGDQPVTVSTHTAIKLERLR